MWPNQAFLKDVIQPHQHIVLFGKVEIWGSRGLQITDPEFEIVKDEPDGSREPGTGTTIARCTRAASCRSTSAPAASRRTCSAGSSGRRWSSCRRRSFDPLPADILARERLADRRDGAAADPFPRRRDAASTRSTRSPRRRSGGSSSRTSSSFRPAWRCGGTRTRRCASLVSTVDDRVRQGARAVLPFKLTEGSATRCAEIVADMQKPWPMQRLLQGDVGAGKTIVALLAAIVAMENGFQVAFMAPTEILAEQHFRTLARCSRHALSRRRCSPAASPPPTRRDLLPAIERGDVKLVVGTHALVQEHVSFKALALAVIDEQHRFGVVQRGTLAAKGLHPDVLVMTATPIPRTLALTECGDMDVSVIRGLPPGRQPIRTLVKPDSRRDEVYALMREELARGRQAYVIYPLVEESEKIDLKAATAMAEQLTRGVPGVHGRAAARPHEGRREGRA